MKIRKGLFLFLIALFGNTKKMKWFFKKALKKTYKLSKLSKEDLVFHIFPHLLGELMAKYFRMEVEGLEHIPKKGAGIIASNHSGYSGFDAFLLCHHIYYELRRTPRVLTHKLWFWSKTTAIPAQKLGFIKATKDNGLETLKNKKLMLIFPEGEDGNFKPTLERYRLQPFKKGVIRMALQTGAPIIPTLVIGAEETHINLAKLKFSKYLKGLTLPMPLNVIPLPARWKIKVLPAYKLSYGPEALNDESLIQAASDELREYMQAELRKELKKRKWIFL